MAGYTLLPVDTKHYSTWLEIDLQAIQHNIGELQRIAGRPIMAVVKANAYGHGLVEVALAAEAAGASWCGVARIEEGLALRRAGFKQKILVLGYTPPSRASDAASKGISLAVYDQSLVQAYAAHAQNAPAPLKVHVKVDTGMSRLGLFPEESIDFTRWLRSQPNIEVEGFFTHFACADEPDLPTTDQQMDRFQRVLDELIKTDLRPTWVHACNSAAALCFPRARLDLIRPGIAMYGLQPSRQTPLPPGFRSALSLKTRLLSVKTHAPGSGISYGHRYFTQNSERIGVIANGYADGFRRTMGNSALVHGVKVPIIGNVCMDQCMLQLDSVPNAKIGDEVVLIGRQGQAAITAEEVAQTWGTIDYEVICGMADRLPRLYLRGTKENVTK